MDQEIPPPLIFPTDNNGQPTDSDIMRSHAIDTLFASEYHIGDTEKIETTEALRAPDREQFIYAIKKEVHSLILETKTFTPPTPNQDQRRIRGEHRPEASMEDKDHAEMQAQEETERRIRQTQSASVAAARGDTLRRAMIKAKVPLPASYRPTIIMPLTFSLFLQLTVIRKLHMATMGIESAYLNAALPPEAN